MGNPISFYNLYISSSFHPTKSVVYNPPVFSPFDLLTLLPSLARQLFSSLKEQSSGVQVELGDDAKYPVAGVGTIPFQLQLGHSLDFDDVLFVPGLKKNLLSFSLDSSVLEFSDRTELPYSAQPALQRSDYG